MNDVTEVTGMILFAAPIGEYDKRVVLLTKERGKIAAFAKGARRMNSSLLGMTQPFSFGTFQIYEGRNSYTIKHAKIQNYFSEISNHLNHIYYGCYFAEISDYYGKENLDASSLINLLYIALKALLNPNIPNELVRYIFELKAMELNGEYPEFYQCAHCGSQEKLMMFSTRRFGVVCEQCEALFKDGIHISQLCIYTMQYIISSKLEKLFTFSVSEEVLRELRLIMEKIRNVVIDKKIKSQEVLESCNDYKNQLQ